MISALERDDAILAADEHRGFERGLDGFEEALRLVPEQTVLCVGDVMLDRYWFGDVERISPEAPVPVVKIARSAPRNG